MRESKSPSKHLLSINNYLLTESGVLTRKSKPRPCRIDRAIATIRFSCKDRTFEVNELFIIWLLLCLCRPVIGPWALRENNTLQLANQSVRTTCAVSAKSHASYISCEKPQTKCFKFKSLTRSTMRSPGLLLGSAD